MSAWDDATQEDAVAGPFPYRPQESALARDGNGEFTVPVPVPEIDTSRLMLLHKWMAQHHAELQQMTGEKAAEYGSLDLSIMGAGIAKLWPGIGENAPPAAQLQAAIAFYLMGKVARVLSALAEGKPAPTDSWLDAEVYAMMGGYVQEHGRWP